jgi:hypothetical protein
VVIVSLASGLLSAPACGVDTTLESECAPAACPDGSCLKDIACEDGAQCPQGSTCQRGSCLLAGSSDIRAEALIVGFHAHEFDLVRSAGADVQYELVAPDRAARVVCGLFACEPRFAHASYGSTELSRIKNAAQCLQREHVFNTQTSGEPQKFTFRLADLRTPEPTECSSSMLGISNPDRASRAGYPVVEALRLGCWASDKTHVLAATRLIAVSVSDLPEGESVLRSDCQAAPDGSWCSLPGDLGTCQAGGCDFTKRPGVSAVQIDAGGAPNDTAEVPTSCEGLPDDVTCRRAKTDSVGQCLSDRCIKKTQAGQGYSQPLAVSDCAAPGSVTDWLNCYPSPTLSFGTCLQQECRLRCRDSEDCTRALDAAEISCGGSGGGTGCEPARAETCYRPSGSYLGVCVPTDPQGDP